MEGPLQHQGLFKPICVSARIYFLRRALNVNVFLNSTEDAGVLVDSPQTKHDVPSSDGTGPKSPTEAPRHAKDPSRERSPWVSKFILMFSTAIVASLVTVLLINPSGFTSPAAQQEVTVNSALSVNKLTVGAASDSIFTVGVKKGKLRATGSGVAVGKRYIVTNAHVVNLENTSKTVSTIELQDNKGKTYSSKVVGVDPVADLAVLYIPDGNFKPLPWADSKKLAVGEPVLALGAPLGLANTVTGGIVSALNRPVSLESIDTDAGGAISEGSIFINTIQTDAAINSGNSGGALINSEGKLVGINVAISSSRGSTGNIGIGFAIPSSYAQRVVNEILKTGKAGHGRLGVSVETVYSKGGSFQVGAAIKELTKNGPAAKAGLRVNDVILKINGLQISSSESLTATIKAASPGENISVLINRNGRNITKEPRVVGV